MIPDAGFVPPQLSATVSLETGNVCLLHLGYLACHVALTICRALELAGLVPPSCTLMATGRSIRSGTAAAVPVISRQALFLEHRGV